MVYMPHWPVILGRNTIKLGLERIQTLLEKLGNPHLHLPPVIHVAGTNGKGSTIAFMRSILEAAGYKVHCYTSPHLVRFNERIVVAGNEIQDDYLTEILEECRLAAEGLNVTFFEGTTAAAFLAFSRIEADILLLETGLGGRLDSTNVVPYPLLTVLASISMDHMEYLGGSIASIAEEKAHIMRRGVPCVVSPQLEEAMKTITVHADMVNAPLIEFDKDWTSQLVDGRLCFTMHGVTYTYPNPALPGIHQIINAGTAIAAMKSVEGYTITDQHITDGLQNASWPARLQKLNTGSLLELLPNPSWEIWLDGGHNPAAGFMLANWIDMHLDKPVYIIAGLTKGKDGVGFFSPFKGKTDIIASVFIADEPSSQRAEEVAKSAEEAGLNAKSFSDVESAIRFFTRQELPPGRILVCGSLFLAGGILKQCA